MVMADEDETRTKVKKAVEEGRPLDIFEAYLKTFQRDVNLKEVTQFNGNKLIVPAALRFLHNAFTKNSSRRNRDESSVGKHLVASFIPENLQSRKKHLHSV